MCTQHYTHVATCLKYMSYRQCVIASAYIEVKYYTATEYSLHLASYIPNVDFLSRAIRRGIARMREQCMTGRVVAHARVRINSQRSSRANVRKPLGRVALRVACSTAQFGSGAIWK